MSRSWRIRITRKGFRRNGPRNIFDPMARVQYPVGWTYIFFGRKEE